jgi:hypothetical protein
MEKIQTHVCRKTEIIKDTSIAFYASDVSIWVKATLFCVETINGTELRAKPEQTIIAI